MRHPERDGGGSVFGTLNTFCGLFLVSEPASSSEYIGQLLDGAPSPPLVTRTVLFFDLTFFISKNIQKFLNDIFGKIRFKVIRNIFQTSILRRSGGSEFFRFSFCALYFREALIFLFFELFSIFFRPICSAYCIAQPLLPLSPPLFPSEHFL